MKQTGLYVLLAIATFVTGELYSAQAARLETAESTFRIGPIPATIGFNHKIEIRVTNLTSKPQPLALALYLEQGAKLTDISEDILAASWNEARRPATLKPGATAVLSWRPCANEGTNYDILENCTFKLRAHGERDDVFSNEFKIERNPIEFLSCQPAKFNKSVVDASLENISKRQATIRFTLQVGQDPTFKDVVPCLVFIAGKKRPDFTLKSLQCPTISLEIPGLLATGRNYRLKASVSGPPPYESFSISFVR